MQRAMHLKQHQSIMVGADHTWSLLLLLRFVKLCSPRNHQCRTMPGNRSPSPPPLTLFFSCLRILLCALGVSSSLSNVQRREFDVPSSMFTYAFTEKTYLFHSMQHPWWWPIQWQMQLRWFLFQIQWQWWLESGMEGRLDMLEDVWMSLFHSFHFGDQSNKRIPGNEWIRTKHVTEKMGNYKKADGEGLRLGFAIIRGFEFVKSSMRSFLLSCDFPRF